MSVRKRNETSTEETDQDILTNGVSDETAAQAKADMKEVKDQEAPAFLPEDDDDDDGLKEPPEGVTVTNEGVVLASGLGETSPGHVFGDEFVGKAGSFAVGQDGVRRPVYEKYLNAAGKERFRPVA